MDETHLPTVSWLELLQDLIMVVLAVALFNGLQYGWGTSWVWWYFFAILAAYGSWVSWVLVNNRFPETGLFAQATTILWIYGALLAAGGSLWENWLSTRTLNLGLAVSFAALAVRHTAIAVRYRGARASSAAAAGLSFGATFVLLLGAKGIVPEYLAMGCGPLVALVGLLVVYPRMLPPSVVINVDHLSERFGQFVLILLGDGLLEIVLNIERGGTTTVLAVGVAVAMTFLLWRAYFIYVMPAGLPSTLNRFQVWTAAHLVVVVGIGLTSASIAAEAVNLPPELLEHMQAFTAAVGATLTLAMAYVGLALTTLLAARPSRVRALTFGALAAFLATLHFVLGDGLTLKSALVVIVAMAAADTVLRFSGTRAVRRS
jgi:low temperature requirement protein LtrA